MIFVQRGPCSYLPDREWALAMRDAPAGEGADAAYRALLETSHRRSGFVVYRPVCQACTACQPIRVPVATFEPTRSQRRAQRRNADVSLELGPLEPTLEKADLLERFTHGRFAKEAGEAGEPELRLARYAESFGRSPVTTREMRYRVEGRLVGLGIVDLLPDVVSSVYFCFDPAEARRSLGVHSGLCEVDLARATGRAYWYLGYYIAGCRAMQYKARFGPCEVHGPSGWVPFTPQDDDEDTA